MRLTITIATCALSLFGAALPVLAQSAPPTFRGDPDVYKVIFEDQNFRVIDVNRKKGVTDKPHGHPVPGIIYNITDCSTRLRDAGGQTRDNVGKAGTASATPIVASHTAENTGAARDSLEEFACSWGHEITEAPTEATRAARAGHDDGKAIDPVTVASPVLSIPSTALAVADRICKRRRPPT